jgi:septation ring formation regulator EzrA
MTNSELETFVLLLRDGLNQNIKILSGDIEHLTKNHAVQNQDIEYLAKNSRVQTQDMLRVTALVKKLEETVEQHKKAINDLKKSTKLQSSKVLNPVKKVDTTKKRMPRK